MTIKVRNAAIQDAAEIGRLANQFALYLRSLGDTGDLNLTTDAILRDGFGENPAFFAFVAERNGTILGYLLYHFGYDADIAARTLHVVDLYVAQEARQQGIGRTLMIEAAKRCREAGATEMFWSVYIPNKLALKFYESLGARYTKDLLFMKLDASKI